MGIVIDTNILICPEIRVEIRDLLIAAIALQNGCKLFTNNKDHFEGIEGLSLQD